jgi:hypothetical protein
MCKSCLRVGAKKIVSPHSKTRYHTLPAAPKNQSRSCDPPTTFHTHAPNSYLQPRPDCSLALLLHLELRPLHKNGVFMLFRIPYEHHVERQAIVRVKSPSDFIPPHRVQLGEFRVCEPCFSRKFDEGWFAAGEVCALCLNECVEHNGICQARGHDVVFVN